MIKRTQKPKIHYVDNKKLLEAMRDYKDKLEKDPNTRVSNYIGKCIMDIATELATLPKFSGYSFKDEMISDGVENSIRYIYNFDPYKYEKPFAYFTKIIYYAFLRRIESEKTELYTKYKITANHGIFNDVIVSDDEGTASSVELYDNIADFIQTFEKKKAEKNANKPKKVKGVEQFIDD